jgi:hypothetical protein
MYLISINLHVVFHFEVALKSLDLWRVLVLRCQHDNRNGDFECVIAVHQRGMNFCRGTEECVLSGAQRNDLLGSDLSLAGLLCAHCYTGKERPPGSNAKLK